MATLPTPVNPGFPNVYQIEVADRVKGGAGGTANLQAEQLLERTAFLKKQIDDAVSGALTVMYATRLKTARTITMTGDGAWSVSFDGNGNVTSAMTLANTAVVAGTYPVITVDAKGRATAGRALQSADLPASPALTGTPTAPTAAAGTNTPQLATTAFVQRDFMAWNVALDNVAGGVVDSLARSCVATVYNPGWGVDGMLLHMQHTNSGNYAVQLLASNWGQGGLVWRYKNGGGWSPAKRLAETDSPALTGTPTCPTPALGTNTQQLVNAAFVQATIAALIASSPAALDTLNELAAALGDDPNFATTMTNALAAKLNSSAYTAADVLAKIKTVDGVTSGLDADMLDGQDGSYYLNWNNFTGKPTQLLPAGIPLDWIGLTPPSWAVVRDGSALTRASYAAVFAALCPTRSGTLTNGQTTVTGLSTTLDMWVGMPIEGTGVPAGTTVGSITGTTSITLSTNATASGAQTLTLFPFGYGNGGSAATFGVPDDRGVHTRAYDSGRGYEQSTLTANTNSNTSLTGITSTRGLFVGMPVSGAGIPASTTITQINSSTSVTISNAATATATAVALTVTGRQIGAEGTDEVKSHSHAPLSPQTGFYGPGGSGTSIPTGATSWSSQASTANTGGPENNVKRRIYLPIITLGV